ncbi:MAG: Gfo/Idh/MocA family oxidoreductase [Betaproteobacteria bacterium]|nr:MAG: Gfo/Idh/MocA family oxidoreductase [Betaproteobacteria bacterium]
MCRPRPISRYRCRSLIPRKSARSLERATLVKKNPKRIGLAIIGAGRVGLFRGEVAARHPQVDFIGLAEIKPDRAKFVADKLSADFVTADYRELLARPEVTAAIIATDEHLHVDPILAAVERGLSLLIEKPLATELSESERVLEAIQKSGVDAVVGYTQRFRRRWLTAKEKVRTGQLGDVTLVTSRAFMNRLVALDNYQRTNDPKTISPMVISGTHALDIVMWMMEAKRPVEVYARSIDKALGPICNGIDATAGMITFEDLARRGLQPRRRHRRHRRRAHHRRHAPRYRPCDQHFPGRRLRTGCEPSCRFSRQLPAG